MNLEISRDEAVTGGLLRYFTGKPCSRGHLEQRLVVSRACVLCARQNAKQQAIDHPERIRENKRRYDQRRRSDVRVWARHMASATKVRARCLSVPFNLSAVDILAAMPTNGRCPALDIPLVFGGPLSRNSPSIDRLVPADGYVAGNISIISHKANSMKQDAAHPDELRRVANYMEHRLAQRRGDESRYVPDKRDEHWRVNG